MTTSLYDHARKKRSLENAWRVVYENGISSKSDTTRKQIKEFAVDANRHLERICAQLRMRRFKFPPAEGILATKPGKTSKRPIVLAPIESRIVQRAILDVLQSYDPLKPYFLVDTSFGGIKKRSVSDAITMVYNSIQSGSKYFIRSDIKSFFTKIPKPTIYSIIEKEITDTDFLALFKEAITTELSNLDRLGSDKDSFPIYDIGVAQGSCLSPLLGNILLREFDVQMNKGDIKCVRYVDDFILLAPTQKAINAAFKRAATLLTKHGLEAYNPRKDKDKAESGKTAAMFTFLGCDIRPGIIRPNRKSQKRLLDNLDDTLKKSTDLMSNPEKMVKKHRTVTESLNDISNIMKGWSNQYSFCNDFNLMKQMDKKVDGKIANYLYEYAKWRAFFQNKGLDENRRRLLGVHLLADNKKDPIIKL